jgi:hypothetical protein
MMMMKVAWWLVSRLGSFSELTALQFDGFPLVEFLPIKRPGE